MKVTYKKLWVLCAEREMSKAELRKRAGLSSATFTKLRKNQEVNLSVLLKIADVMNCNAGEMRIISERLYYYRTNVHEGVVGGLGAKSCPYFLNPVLFPLFYLLLLFPDLYVHLFLLPLLLLSFSFFLS